MLGAGLLSAPLFAAEPARPGTVNYIEGAAFLDGRPLNNRNIGNLAMDAGDELSTATGKAEILLTPGIYLRIDSNSAVKMVAPDLELTQVEVDHGRVGVEVDQIFPQNNVRIVDAGVETQLVKTGYYEFDANHPEAQVFHGRAEVEVGDGKYEPIKNHHELALEQGAHLKTVNFVARGTGDDLYNWSSLRSQYLAEANNQIAGDYAYGAGFNPGWYWDPYAYDYTFIGMNPFYSPFGWGFYPWGGFYGAGFYGRGFYGHGYYGGGFHGGAGFSGGVHGGGFAGGGGFHGGGGFGGGHGR
ncbi:MAG TPA: hypothetical protein VGF96_18815 [Terracidiphilus sp.]|jgi:uncharacterized membrane protein YgcG